MFLHVKWSGKNWLLKLLLENDGSQLGAILVMSGEILGCHNWGEGAATGIVGRGQVCCFQKTSQQTKNYLDQNSTNAEVEKPCSESIVSQKRLKGYVNMYR